uniref:Uncharacterized protein n=1 Tax=Meloidogyne floridensis TaxID=298350 RepID=A0A915NSK2_9BILA
METPTNILSPCHSPILLTEFPQLIQRLDLEKQFEYQKRLNDQNNIVFMENDKIEKKIRSSRTGQSEYSNNNIIPSSSQSFLQQTLITNNNKRRHDSEFKRNFKNKLLNNKRLKEEEEEEALIKFSPSLIQQRQQINLSNPIPMSSNSTPVFTQQPSNSGQITKNKLCKQKSASFDSSSQNSNYLFNNNQRRLTANEGTTNKEFIKRRLLVFQEIETYRMRLLEAEEEQQKQIENIKEERIPPTTSTLLNK